MSTKGKMKHARRHPWAGEWLDSSHRKASTIAAHERVLDRLFLFISDRGGPAPEEIDFARLISVYHGAILMGKGPIDTQLLGEFLIWHVEGLTDPDAKARKRNGAIYTLRLFFRWCRARQYMALDPTRYLEVASVRRRVNHRRYLTVAESRELLTAAAASGRHAPRDVAVVATLMIAGLRPGELCNLTPGDLDFASGWIRADGKTGEGSAPMPPALAKVLCSYLDSSYFQEWSDGQPTTRLFPNDTGKDPLTSGTLNALIQGLCQAAGIDRGVTTYWLRHTFATRLYGLGMGFIKVSMALRHGKLQNTYVYVHGREDRMRKLVQESPTSDVLSEVYRDMMGLAAPRQP